MKGIFFIQEITFLLIINGLEIVVKFLFLMPTLPPLILLLLLLLLLLLILFSFFLCFIWRKKNKIFIS